MNEAPTLEQFAELTQLVMQTNHAAGRLAIVVAAMSERQTRIETRLVKLAAHLGLDPNGDKRQ